MAFCELCGKEIIVFLIQPLPGERQLPILCNDCLDNCKGLSRDEIYEKIDGKHKI
jgi:hypothetical protein